MTVYILAPDDTSAFSLNRSSAAIGFAKMGEEVRFFTEDTPPGDGLKPTDILVGGIGFVRGALTHLGVELPELPIMPDPLMPYAGRAIRTAPMSDLRSEVAAGRTLFAKPLPSRLKSFNGTLFREFRDLIPTAAVPDTELVSISEPVTFVSEYRCFVLRGDIIDLRGYSGDPLVFPDPVVVKAAVEAFAPQAPAGYGLDFGVTANAETLVVEANDGYALGAYGLPPLRYANLIAARWAELTASLRS